MGKAALFKALVGAGALLVFSVPSFADTDLCQDLVLLNIAPSAVTAAQADDPLIANLDRIAALQEEQDQLSETAQNILYRDLGNSREEITNILEYLYVAKERLDKFEARTLDGHRLGEMEFEGVAAILAGQTARLQAVLEPQDEEAVPGSLYTDIIENPDTLIAEHTYTTEDTDTGRERKFLFSEGLTAELMKLHLSSPNILTRYLSAIQKIATTGHNGLAYSAIDKSIVYLKVLGHSLPWRIWGYLDDSGVIHFVILTNESQHDSKYLIRYTKASLNARSQRPN